MAKPLLYKPPPRWQFWLAVVAALAIHIGAVIASIKREPPAVDLTQIPTAEVVATLEQPQEQPTPPPEDIPLPPPPPEPEIQPEFHEETTPPPRQPQPKQAAPIKAPQVAARPGVTSISNAKAQAVFAPRPEYPYEARSRKITGSGVCVLTIDTPSGSVTDATMAQSIGSPILDNATVSTFKRWRFKPNAFSKVKVPITYTLTGASY
jgi:periplasmic protein TonB